MNTKVCDTLPVIIILFFVFATCSLEAQNNERYNGPVIDMHLHANIPTLDSNGVPITGPCNPTPCEGPQGQATSAKELLQNTLEVMDQHNIVLGFLSQWPLENVYNWVEAAPGRFIASPLVRDPKSVDIDSLRKEYKLGKLGGMGELGIQYEGIEANDPRMEPFYAIAEEFDVPVLIHHHGTAGPSEKFRISIGHPEQLEEVLMRHPKLRLFIETAGFPFLEETIALMYRYPQVYGDLSLWKYPREMFYWYLGGLMDAGLGKRLMFGSDQMQWPETVIAEEIEAIESAPFLNEAQKRDIFYNNAARFLKLSEEQITKHHSK